MIIGGILILMFSIMSFVVGFAIGYGAGYETSQNDKEKTSDDNEFRRAISTMEQDSTWTNSLNNTRF